MTQPDLNTTPTAGPAFEPFAFIVSIGLSPAAARATAKAGFIDIFDEDAIRRHLERGGITGLVLEQELTKAMAAVLAACGTVADI